MGRRRIRIVQFVAATLALMLGLGGCSGEGGGAASGDGSGTTRLAVSDGGITDPERTDVAIVNFAFEDTEFTTEAGSTVWWVNTGSAPHTVTSDLFDSGTIRTNNGFSFEFAEAGEYPYWCKNHPGMEGTIIVE